MSGAPRDIHREAIAAELDSYIDETTPERVSTTGVRQVPRCGRPRAIELTERIRPILDRLYPDWREENKQTTFFEFRAQRDAAARLAARLRQEEEIAALLPEHDESPTLSAGGLHELIWQAAAAQWSTGHRHEAVLAAAKAVNSRLQEKLGRRDVSDVRLVREAFTDNPPQRNRPRLRFSSIADDQTRESMRQGAMEFGAGCFQAIRNPLSHLPNQEHELTEQEALERLAALSLLARWIDEASVEAGE